MKALETDGLEPLTDDEAGRKNGGMGFIPALLLQGAAELAVLYGLYRLGKWGYARWRGR